MGYVYLLKNDLVKADSLFNVALTIAEEINNNENSCLIFRNQALLSIKKSEFNNAIKKIKKSILISENIKNKENQQKGLNILIKAYEATKNYKEANITLKKYYKLQKELKGIEQSKNINALNIKYKVKEKEQEILILKIKNDGKSKEVWFLLILIFTLIIIISSLYYVYSLYKKNSKLELLQMRRDISDYVSQIEEIKEQVNKDDEAKEDNVLKKIKQFGLTKTEEKVLLLITKGFKNAEIANNLFISINTVKTHTQSIFVKLNVRNRVEAARKAH